MMQRQGGSFCRSRGRPPLMGGVPHMEGGRRRASALGWMGPEEGHMEANRLMAPLNE